MRYCQNCGQEISDNTNYCPHCSTPQYAAQPSAISGKNKLHCPECKATRLSTVVETTMNGGTAVHTPVTRRVGVSTITTSSTHRNYWVCNDCGHKFRNLQNLKEELAAETKRMKMALTWCIISAAFAGLCSLSEATRMIFGFGIFLLLVAALIFGGMWLSTRNKVTAMTNERDYLQSHCFD